MISFLKAVSSRFPFARAIKRYTWVKKFIFNIRLRIEPRRACTYTRFLRVPSQYKVLTEIVVPKLLDDDKTKRIEIAVLGCSNGAEAYTISAVLRQSFPDLAFQIIGVDVDEPVLADAERAVYSTDDLKDSTHIFDGFAETIFCAPCTRNAGRFEVKQDLRNRVRFTKGDLFDGAFLSSLGVFDIVFAQNVLFHFKPQKQKNAIANIVKILASNAFIFIDGMDLRVRDKIPSVHSLSPVTKHIEAIHQEASLIRGASWPGIYWGLEPLEKRGDWKTRYSTIFSTMKLENFSK